MSRFDQEVRTPPFPRPTEGLGLSAVLALGAVLFQHVYHAVVFSRPDSLGGHISHVARDSALAMTPAALAVVAGCWLTARLRDRADRRRLAISRAAATSISFSVLLVPSTLVHRLVEGSHGGAAVADHADAAGSPLMLGLRDALIGQLPVFLIVLLSLLVLSARGRRGWNLQEGRWGGALPRGSRRPMRLRPAALAVSLVAGLLSFGPATPAPAAGLDPCATAPQRTYAVSAINVRITYNRFGDNDPFGAMYVLDGKIPAVRAQEQSRMVSGGLGNDAIQPLVLRANLGECLVLNFTNRLTSGLDPLGFRSPAPRASIHAHGLPYQVSSAGSFVGKNPDSTAAPGQSLTYRLYMDPAGGEGGHVFHSHGDDRQQVAHGLFGSIVAEPAGSVYLDPRTGATGVKSGWEAIIQPPTGMAFREFAILYHEVGDESFSLRDTQGQQLPQIDTEFSGGYRPGSRAINYRSEAFMRRLQLKQDKSQAYSSYFFGDPATPIARSYLGEPTKTRLMHAGSEMAHVHHLHGGATRWRRNPDADNTDMGGGLKKTPIQSAKSIRLDSQTISSSESFNLEHECGAGGCQQVAGDFLFHCHISHHYIAGMWGIWRVFDTAQPDLATLPGRPAAPAAVNSAGLIGRTIEGKTIVASANLTDRATQRSVEELVESQLPPQGVRLDDQDATVWDWVSTGTPTAPVYKGEPDDTRTWANYASPTPGARPEILFNPGNGRYTWPLFRPHLGKRPPFSGNGHSGAPWSGETATASRPDGMCPAGAPTRNYNLTAITRPIVETDTGGTDPDGQVFVLNEDRLDVLAGRKPAEPLAIRSNVGDCVALTLSSQLRDNAENKQHSKVNMHTHFVQFDPQASDGVITGFSYEQSVQPFAEENRVMAVPVAAGASAVTVTSTARLRPGISVGIGLGQESIEVRRITAVDAVTGVLSLDRPLSSAHGTGEAVGVEFVQSRWYSDVDSGTVFFHDHVDAINSWDHGLFAAHVIEPPGSTYHDPRTGAQVRSGAIVDIRTNGSVGAGQSGSFREFVLWLHNDLRGTGANDSLAGSINLRAEPFAARSGTAPGTGRLNVDPHVFSSVKYGDPATPLPRAYVGDPFVIRTIGLVEKEGALRVTGHRFRPERFAASGELTDSATTGISERFDYVLDGGAGGPAGKAGDYLYYSTVQREWEDGAWGIIRVHDKARDDLQPLPNRAPSSGSGFPQLAFTGGAPPAATGPGQPCPAGAAVRSHAVTIFAQPLPVGDGKAAATDPAGVVYALSEDVAAIKAGTKPLEPLAIRANVGDCVEITLTNQLSERASLALAKLPYDPQGSSGSAVGLNPDSTVAPNATTTYRFHADRELGTSLFLNLANTQTLVHGAYGALVVEPAGSTYVDSISGKKAKSGLRVNINNAAGNFRELVALFSDADQRIGTTQMPYPQEVEDFTGLNYRQEPLRARLSANPDPSKVYSSSTHGDPDTTLMRAHVGDPVRFRVAVPAAEQFHVFAVEGHRFPWEPAMAGSALLDSRTLGPGQSLDAHLRGGAGGPLGVTGDYLYLDHRMPFTRAGLWGIFRVQDPSTPGVVPLGTPASDGPVTSSGYRAPTAQASAPGGDGDGFESNTATALADGGGSALDLDSGIGTETKCTSAQKDRHQFSGFGLALPASATIRGIEVRLDAKVDGTGGSPAMCVQLSRDGGATWTAAKKTPVLGTAERTFVLGAASDLWGGSWTSAQLNDANLRVRVTNVAGNAKRDFSLDWAAVTVSYQ